MKIIKLKENNFKKAIDLVKKTLGDDGLVVVPSDTVYVLASKATSSPAVKKILNFKGRRPDRGISFFLNNFSQIKDYARYSSSQKEILKILLPGFFTVILTSTGKTAPEIEPGDGTVGVRVVNNDFINKLTKAVDFPITATSANISGKGPHFSINSFLNTLSEKKKKMLDLVIDAGQLPKRQPSTVVRLIEDKIEILRKGMVNPRLVLTKKTKPEAETRKLAREIYETNLKKHLKSKAVVVILQGDLGAGKTVFAKGIGEIFGKEFFSPTFVLLDEHPINQGLVRNIYHLDLFRLETEEEVLELGLAKFLEKGNLFLIEWGEKLSTLQGFKREKVVFFLLQISQVEGNSRGFKFYKL